MNSRKGLPSKHFASKYNFLLQKWDAPAHRQAETRQNDLAIIGQTSL
ncbi:hypothetical protein [Microcystis sp. MC19]|nr:hypothetical protein [Microcystis sp. MC19]